MQQKNTSFPEKVSFGFQKVSADQKTTMVQDVFSRVASRYDLMNDVMSLGIHRLWKNYFLKRIHPQPGQHLLDVAGGTGDISYRFLKAAPQTQATICDLNPQMLEAGQKRPEAQLFHNRLQWICGDASSLPFPDNHFDVYTISFGLRNVTNIQAAINEAYRVLKPGGTYFCLEFSQVNQPLLDQLYHYYSFHIIPYLGKLFANDKEAYAYLVESIARFPSANMIEEMLRNTGFTQVSIDPLSSGIACIHAGWKT